jgi:hypothetical protein
MPTKSNGKQALEHAEKKLSYHLAAEYSLTPPEKQRGRGKVWGHCPNFWVMLHWHCVIPGLPIRWLRWARWPCHMTGHTALASAQPSMGLLLQPTLEDKSSTDTFLWDRPRANCIFEKISEKLQPHDSESLDPPFFRWGRDYNQRVRKL